MTTFNFSHYRNKHWYPGHMLKAIKQITEKLSLVDIAIILQDARLPQISYNPSFNEILEKKAIVRVINKCDMIPKGHLKNLEQYNNYKEAVLFTQLNTKLNTKKLLDKVKSEVTKNRKKKGTTRPLLRPIRAMIIGLPNIGKSTLINNLKKSKIAKAGPRPGVTRHQQWVKINDDIEVLDTPGVMHPHGTGCEEELKLGLANIIRREIIGEEILCEYLLYLLHLNNKNSALEIYEMDKLEVSIDNVFKSICNKRKLLLKEGKIDKQKAALVMLRDYDSKKIPPLSFQITGDSNSNVRGIFT